MKQSCLWPILTLICLLCAGKAHGQFTYIGGNLQIVGAPLGNTQFVASIDYLKQLSASNGFGVELFVPYTFRTDLGERYEFAPGYDAQLVWKRKMLPFLGLRYRLFVGNAFFVGASLNAGLIREQFFADRSYHRFGGDEVRAVYCDYDLKTPFVRTNLESGFLCNVGERMYGTLQGRLGLQITQPRVQSFAEFSQDFFTTTSFRPIQGLDVIGGLLFGLGLKL